jgi:hypothetical protein
MHLTPTKHWWVQKHESIIMRWVTNLNTSVEHLTFDVNQQYIWATHLSLENGATRFVTMDVYVTTIAQMEGRQCK